MSAGEGIGGVRAELADLDAMIASVEANILNHAWVEERELERLYGIRTGLHMARTSKVKRIDKDTLQRLGLAP